MRVVVETLTICSNLVLFESLLDSTSLVGFIATQIKEIPTSNSLYGAAHERSGHFGERAPDGPFFDHTACVLDPYGP